MATRNFTTATALNTAHVELAPDVAAIIFKARQETIAKTLRKGRDFTQTLDTIERLVVRCNIPQLGQRRQHILPAHGSRAVSHFQRALKETAADVGRCTLSESCIELCSCEMLAMGSQEFVHEA